MSQQPLNPIEVTAQAGDRENWATARTSTWLTIHQKRRKINQVKKALKDLVVFTNPPQRENPASPTSVPLQLGDTV